MKAIKTKRFILRPICLKDAKDMAKNMNNWNVIRNLSQIPFPYELKHAKQFAGKIEKEMKKEKPVDFVYVIEIKGEVVGAVGAHKIVHGHKAEMGYWLAEHHWGKGIMPEAAKKFMAHIICEFKLRRVHEFIHVGNEGSKRVAEKIGMTFEGVGKKYTVKDGKYLDCYLYAKVK